MKIDLNESLEKKYFKETGLNKNLNESDGFGDYVHSARLKEYMNKFCYYNNNTHKYIWRLGAIKKEFEKAGLIDKWDDSWGITWYWRLFT